MRWILILLMSLSVGCAQTIGRFHMVSNSPLSDEGIEFRPSSQENWTEAASKSSCIHVYFILQDRFSYDLKSLIENACPKGQLLRNVQLERKYWIIPLVYGKDCLDVVARCQS